jgi:hypothetical protein
MLDLAKLRNITVFMRMAAESGALKAINDVMAFAETLDALGAEIKKLEGKEEKPAVEKKK